MPETSRFFGIIIRMYFNDHDPAHFHAIYGDDEAVVGIDPIQLKFGRLPPRAFSLVVEWAGLHQRELLENWQALRSGQLPSKISPLE